MIRSQRRYLCCMVGVLGVIGGLQLPQRVNACDSVGQPGSDVRIADEEAAIIWDSAFGVEHFIRKATFKTNAKDFGFLVPTPATPDLAEAKGEIFEELDRLSTVHRWSLGMGGASSDSASAVDVVKSQRVGGLDAVVLRADDAASLTHWLRSHGYAGQPSMNVWLSAYVAARWKITAFKIAGEGGAGDGVTSTVVRMSFPCSKPYFPYREPADQREGASAGTPRLLKIYFLSEGPMEGAMGKGSGWPGRATFSRPVDEGWRPILAEKFSLSPAQLPSPLWLTVFEDDSSPRPGIDDVYFHPASPEHSQPFPETSEDQMHAFLIDTAGILLLLGMTFLYLRSRRRLRRQAGNDAGRTRALDGSER